MSDLSQFSGGGNVVGSQSIFGYGSPGNNAPTIDLADGSIWLRQGVLGLASDFPQLAKLARYGFVGKVDYSTAVALPAAARPGGLSCFDAARNLLHIASNTAGALLRSTDGGATFAQVVLPGCLLITGVASNGVDLLMAVGYTAGHMPALWYSTNGAVWMAGVADLATAAPADLDTYASASVDPGAGAQAICWTGTKFVGLYRAGGTSYDFGYVTFSTTTGGSVTKSAAELWFPNSINLGLSIDSDGAGNVAVLAVERVATQRSFVSVSATSGTSWSSRSAGEIGYSGTTFSGIAVVAGKAYIALMEGSAVSYAVVPNMASIASLVKPSVVLGQHPAGTRMVKYGGALYVVGGGTLARINQATHAIDSVKNIAVDAIYPLSAKLLAVSPRSSQELITLTTDMGRVDSCGMLGSAISTGQYSTTAGATYVRAK